MAVLFEQSVSGLVVGADVRFKAFDRRDGGLNAIVVGEGESAQVRLDRFSDRTVASGSDLMHRSTMRLHCYQFVARGVRPHVTGNIWRARCWWNWSRWKRRCQRSDRTDGPYPVIPTTDSLTSATAEGLLTRADNLPVEELMDGAIDLLDGWTGWPPISTRATPAALAVG